MFINVRKLEWKGSYVCAYCRNKIEEGDGMVLTRKMYLCIRCGFETVKYKLKVYDELYHKILKKYGKELVIKKLTK